MNDSKVAKGTSFCILWYVVAGIYYVVAGIYYVVAGIYYVARNLCLSAYQDRDGKMC